MKPSCALPWFAAITLAVLTGVNTSAAQDVSSANYIFQGCKAALANAATLQAGRCLGGS